MCCYRFPITRKGGESEFEMNSWLKYCAFCWVVFWCGENMGLRWGIKERSIPTKVQRKGHSRRLRWKHIFIVMGKYKFWPRKLFTSFMKIARLDDCVRVFELDWLQNVSNLSFATYENCDLKVRKFHHKITKFCYEMFISRCQKAKNIVKYASVIATRVIFVKDAYLL
jgi:hypothetical protein